MGRMRNGENKSGYPGIWKDHDKWCVVIRHNGIRKYCGRFWTIQDARNAWVDMMMDLFGEVPDTPTTGDPYIPSAEEKAAWADMEYPLNPLKVIDAAMRMA